jgi:hypothetical protein
MNLNRFSKVELRLSAFLGAVVIASSIGFLSGCGSSSVKEHYVSPQVQGETAKINLDEVQKAFWDTRGSDLNTWMAAFEKRVNEIYEGKEVISIDATREKGHLVVTGYFDTQKKQGFVAGDEKLFSIEQTGEAADNEMPYRVANQDGRTYYEGHHSILDNPFLQAMLISHMMGGFGGHYYTPYDRTVILQSDRNAYRSSPSWGTQKAANQDFQTRFKQKAFGGGLQSKTGFGSSGFSSTPGGTSSRSWGSSNSVSTPPAGATTGWGGRRSSTSGGFSGFRASPSFGRGWGGRRR